MLTDWLCRSSGMYPYFSQTSKGEPGWLVVDDATHALRARSGSIPGVPFITASTTTGMAWLPIMQ